MFVRTNIFKNCISTSIDNFKSIQIEQAYTKSYFQLGYHMEYSRYTWTRDFNNHLNYNEHVISLINEISGKLIYIKHNRNNHLPSVGSGYFI
jgi:hypothetical protein